MIRWFLLLLALAGPAPAHQESLSYGAWHTEESSISVNLRHRSLDLSAARLHPAEPDYLPAVSTFLQQQTEIWRDGVPCTSQSRSSVYGPDDWVSTHLEWTCPASGEWKLHFSGLFDHVADHSHLLHWRNADGTSRTAILNENNRDLTVAAGEAPVVFGLTRFLELGVSHILGGWDHLSFVLALMLLLTSLRDLIWLITSFTIAHSLTLAASSLGLVSPASSAVEAIIALSILLMCLENAWNLRPSRWLLVPAGLLLLALLASPSLSLPLTFGLLLFTASQFTLGVRQWPYARQALCFGFGLFHGFGFAGVLQEMAIPDDQRILSLLGFNLGVELGQLLVVIPLWWLLREARKAWGQAHTVVVNGLVAALATYWLTLRLL